MDDAIKIQTLYSMDPITIERQGYSPSSKIMMRIGGPGQGEGRYCLMSPEIARRVAHTLLAESWHVRHRQDEK